MKLLFLLTASSTVLGEYGKFGPNDNWDTITKTSNELSASADSKNDLSAWDMVWVGFWYNGTVTGTLNTLLDSSDFWKWTTFRSSINKGKEALQQRDAQKLQESYKSLFLQLFPMTGRIDRDFAISHLNISLVLGKQIGCFPLSTGLTIETNPKNLPQFICCEGTGPMNARCNK